MVPVREPVVGEVYVNEQMRTENANQSHEIGEIGEIVPPVLWRLFVLIWLLFLYYPLLNLFGTHATTTAMQLVLTLAGVALFTALYLWLALPLPFGTEAPTRLDLRTHARPLVLAAVLVADITLLTLFASLDWLWFFIFASIALGARLPARPAIVAVAAVAVLAVEVGVGPFGWVYALRVALPVAVVGLGMIGVGRLVQTIRALRTARQELARLAVTEERLRFARDLHDLLGQSLSTITLKNELARSLVRTQPERAVQELGDAIGLARAALRDVREAVTGYRQPTLATELRNAQELLRAAGIECRVEQTLPPGAVRLPLNVETVFAWAVREGVTNVVRYSGARTCTIELRQESEAAVLTVTDDGRGIAPTPSSDSTAGRSGTGLRGLAERASHVQGEVGAGPSTPTGFRLRVRVPLSAHENQQAASAVDREEGR
jgi:two-component system, NarL family, sensor histidine kinase DesK